MPLYLPAASSSSTTYSGVFRFRSGRYYCGSPFTGSGTNSLNNGDMHIVPFPVDVATTFDRIAVEVTTAAAASSVLRLGIYQDTGAGFPGAVLLDAGTVASTSTGTKEITISQSLSPAVYWLAMQAENSSGSVSTRCGNSNAIQYAPPMGRSGANATSTADLGYYKNGGAGAVGSLVTPLGSANGTAAITYIWLRAA